MVSTHKPPQHSADRITEGEKESNHFVEIKALIQESKAKMNMCDEAASSLDGSLRDLQMQRDNARGLIQETFQSYKAILEARQVCGCILKCGELFGIMYSELYLILVYCTVK